jgi:hypothetical protein
MIYHILNGDSLADGFNLEGEIIICREALIEGNVMARSPEDFWQIRADFVKKTYGANDYFEKVKSEFDKLGNLKPTDEINLWFGNEVFCQVNMWFILWFFGDKPDNAARFYRVSPDSEGWNCSFNNLQKCFQSRKRLRGNDLLLGFGLWMAVCSKHFESIKNLSKMSSDNFLHLNEICQALIEIDTKPKAILREITQNGETDFGKIFSQFQAKAGVYGFGDVQVKNILNSL